MKKLLSALFATKKRKLITITSVIAVVLVIVIAVGIVLVLGSIEKAPVGTASGESSSNINSGEPNPDNGETDIPLAGDKGNTSLPVVDEVGLPDVQYSELTREEMVDKYRAHTDWRIYQIRSSASSVKPQNGGKAYYVSNNGRATNDGLTPETALSSPDDLRKIFLKKGDVVYFERGSVFRGNFTIKTSGVAYSAYGEGEKPKFYASADNYANVDYWEKTDKQNVYKLNNINNDVGTIVFNEGEHHGIKHIPTNPGQADSVDVASKENFSTYKDLKENFDFYHDHSSDEHTVYLYYDGGNPGDKFQSIELCIKKHIISVTVDDVLIDNLCLKYGGAHGISSGSRVGLTVQNCEFGWIGGSIQNSDYSSNTRYGNAVEIWGAATDFYVTDSYFYQIYDAAVTFQYKDNTPSKNKIKYQNIHFNNNVMDYCNYSIEYFLSEGVPGESYTRDIYFNGNQMWYAGEGFCSQRPDKTGAHIKSWGHVNNAGATFEIKDNLFALAADRLLETYSKNGFEPDYSGNTYIQFEDRPLGRTGNRTQNIKLTQNMLENVFKDTTAKIVVVK